jgi:sugar/nucleoside kinase (ribokinase family)
MANTREQICASASAKLNSALSSLGSRSAVVGLDGFVDEIIALVDKRISKDHYEPMKTISVLGNKILHAAGESSNYELIVKQTKLGGNGPIMANALASAGMAVTYIGNLGYPTLHPVFAELAARAKVYSIADPGHTDALEFEDGKLMLGKHQCLGDINWDNLVSRVGKDQLIRLFNSASLIAMTNWTMLSFMTDIWAHLQSDIFPHCQKGGRLMFIDLADPEKRTRQDIAAGLERLAKFQGHADLILGLNLKEAGQIADVLGIKISGDPEAAIESTARAIREKLSVGCVVIHPRGGAAAATAEISARFAGPFVQQPKISTGAGDHFNAGFTLGAVLGLTLEERLCTGVASSGYYVRTAASPTGKQLAEFIANLPAPQS